MKNRDQRLKNLLDRTFIDLYSDYHEYHDNVVTSRATRALEIAAWIEADSSGLDVGSGDGLNGKLIAEQTGAHIEGCDIVDKAKSLMPVKVVDLNNEGLKLDKTYHFQQIFITTPFLTSS